MKYFYKEYDVSSTLRYKESCNDRIFEGKPIIQYYKYSSDYNIVYIMEIEPDNVTWFFKRIWKKRKFIYGGALSRREFDSI